VSSRLTDRAGAGADLALGLHRPGPDSASERPVSELLKETGKAFGGQVITETEEGVPYVAVLQLVAKAGLITSDHLTDRLFRREAEELLDAHPRADAKLHRLVLQGYLEHRTVAYDVANSSTPADLGRAVGGVAFDRGYSITQKAAQDFNLPLPPTLRESFITHHVKTMDAIWHVERDYRLRGYQVLDWKTESELVRDNFAGKVFQRGVIVPKFPDAQLTVQGPDGSVETINVEYVSRSYTNQMISEKREAFAGTRTIWACPSNSSATAARVQALTGEEPLTV
jgi:hypothetical protein